MAIVSINVSGTVAYNYIPVVASFSSGGGLASYYRFFLNGAGSSSLLSFSSPVSSATKYYQYTGLSERTTYTLTVHFYDSSKSSLGSSSITVTTPSAPDTTAPTITRWGVNQTGTTSVQMYYGATDNVSVSGFWFYLNGSSYGSASGSSGVYTFSGLSPDTTYTFGVKAYDSSGNQSSMTSMSWKTLKSRPSNFSWDSSKTSGGTFNITASEWNRLTSSINKFRYYKDYSTYSFTTAVKGASFTATMYNQAVNAISAMSPPTSAPNTRSAGDYIRASDIDRLRISLNSIL